MELFQKKFNAGHWRTHRAICSCSQICNWSTWCLENPPNCKYKHYQISSGARASLVQWYYFLYEDLHVLKIMKAKLETNNIPHYTIDLVKT